MPESEPESTCFHKELQQDFVNEHHIQAFAHALTADYFVDNEYYPETPQSPSTISVRSGRSQAHSGARSPRIRKVSALSDFAPVNVRVRKRRTGASHQKKQEWLFVLVRWPLLILIFLFIFFEFGLYIFVRQCVNAKEWFTAWRGRKKLLRKRLRAANTYEEWKAAARVLDDYLGFDEWKAVDEDPYYDWKLVRKVLKSLRALRKSDDVRSVLGVLETCIRTNFAGVESARLYSETFLGTKDLIEAYITEVEKSLVYIRESTVLSNEEKRRFFKSANKHLGISALCLSGGASFGYYHFGVVKAFVQANLLPRVINGTSAGGLVAALACTRTDAELKCLMAPELADKITACEEPFRIWIKRFWKTGARFDSVDWARKTCFFTRGSLTFREAYMRTAYLNISRANDAYSPTKLLNYLSAPDTVIWSALIASAAVPGILNPVVLMQKTRDGNLVPWNWGSKFRDGSLRVDIPLQSLNMYFNVTHPVVSQVNPHVHLFFFAPRGSAGKPVAHRKGKGWRGNFLLSAAEQWLKLELTKNFKVIRDLDLLPQLLGQDWSSVFLQRFDGTVTIWPKTRMMDWFRILSDPDRKELERMTKVGEAVTWPKLHIIENRFRIEREILRGRRAARMQNRERLSTTYEQPAFDAGSNADMSLGHPFSPDSANMENNAPWTSDTDMESPDSNGRSRRESLLFDSNTTPGSSGAQFQWPNQDGARRGFRLHSRRWASQQFEVDAGGSSEQPHPRRFATPDPPPEPEETADAGRPSLLSRLRRRSLPSLSFPSPFTAIRGRRPHQQENSNNLTETPPMDQSWSSDSSELDDELHVNEGNLSDALFDPVGR